MYYLGIIIGLKICLDTAYFAETEILLLKILWIKVKIS